MSQTAAAPIKSRRRWPWYLLFFLLSWLVAGIVTLPLSVIRPLLYLPNAVQVGDLSGTIWRGSAVVTIRDGKKQLPPVTVHGGLLPASLLTLDPTLRLNTNSSGVRLSGRVALAGDEDEGKGKSAPAWPVLEVSDIKGQISALSPWIGQYVPFDLGGLFTLKSPRILIDRNGPWAGKLSINWQGATLDTTETLELGQFKADLAIHQGIINGKVRSVRSPAEALRLKLEVVGALNQSKGLKVTGRVGAGPAASETLREQLKMIGRPGADGMIAINQVLRP